jgi:DNA-binding response OmpR family regulator
MVVDDELDVAAMLAFTLAVEGYEVATFSDGQSALDAIHASHPDIVILDVMMPKLDGIEVLRRLKADAATRDIPVVMLTARVGDEDVWEGWQAGADYYLTKPFEPNELYRYLASCEDPTTSGAAQSARP